MSGWNSSYINHFTQPDTIIPNPYNSQSWDRYAYVLNNPVKLSDPTGHQCVGEPAECLDTNNKPINGAGKPSGKPLSKSGQKIRDLYNRYKEQYGDMTIEQFFGWMMYFEMSGNQNTAFIYKGQTYTVLQMMTEIIARQLWADASGAHGGHAPYCSSSNCVNGLFNFLGDYAQVAIDRAGDLKIPVNDYPSGYQQITADGHFIPLREQLLTDASQFTVSVLNPDPAWTVYGYDLPYHWGNYDSEGIYHGPSGGNDATGVIFSVGTFVLVTQHQDNCHMSRIC